jgi:hypothetical protein
MSEPTFHEQVYDFGHIGYLVDEHRLAVVNAAGTLLVGENPYPFDHPNHAATDAYFARLDGGTPTAVDQRLPGPLLDLRVQQWDFLCWPEVVACAPIPGVARIRARDWRGNLLCQARTTAECWPDGPGTPLGRAGCWWGTAAEPVWLGDTAAALEAALTNLRHNLMPVTAVPWAEAKR